MHHGSRKLHVSISSRMVAELVFDHGSTIGCVGEPFEADGGSVGYGTTRCVEKSLGATGLVGAKETVNLRRRVEKVA